MSGPTPAEMRDLDTRLHRIVEELCVQDNLLRKQNELLEDIAEGMAFLVNQGVVEAGIKNHFTASEMIAYGNRCGWIRPSKRKEAS